MLGKIYNRLRYSRARIPSTWFEELYAGSDDPWSYAKSDYEHRKFKTTLGSLGRQRYSRCLEVGCSIGVLTSMLGEICDEVVGIDLVQRSVDLAAERCAHQPHVSLVRMTAPDEWPEGTFDLVILSEVIYFLSPADVKALIGRLRASLRPGGEIVAIHHWNKIANRVLPWISKTHHRHNQLIAGSKDFTELRNQVRTDQYRLDVFKRGAAASAAH